MSSTNWQLGWNCGTGSDFDECLIERLTWLGGESHFGRRVFCRYHEAAIGDYIQRHMAGEQAQLMRESVVSRAKILDERDLEDQLQHTPVMSTTLADVRDVIHGGCCHA